MLQTQVNYWTLQENKRHNLVSEDLGFQTLEETKRHNLVTESLESQKVDLGYRQLDLGHAQLNETQRHNIVTEAQSAGSLDLGWFNATEAVRSHKANEALQAEANQIGFINAAANTKNANTREEEYRLDKSKSQVQMQWDYEFRQNEQERKWYDSETDRIRAEYGQDQGWAKIGQGFMSIMPALIP